MIDYRKLCEEQLSFTLNSSALSSLGEKYQGKVRDCYLTNQNIFLITTDRLSAFDVNLTTIPFKGEILNAISYNAFKETEEIVQNHVIDVPDPNIVYAKKVEILPIEVVVRGYLAGSALRDYKANKPVSGITLREGYKDYSCLDQILLTPSTKAEKGLHDEPISENEIVSKNLVSKKIWDEIKEVSFALFKKGSELANNKGLILVDTKYEFGLLNGKLILADEIHTLDSSRYWIKSDYESAISEGRTPKMLDKEPVRQWLISKGFMGEGEVPEFTREKRVEIAMHYIDTAKIMLPEKLNLKVEDVNLRMEANLKAKKYL